MAKLIGLVALCCALLAAEAADACWVPRISSFHNQTVTTHMSVRTGKRCSIVFWSRGPTASHEVTRRPSHGSVQVGAIGRITYQSRAGYVGSDEFAYVQRGRDALNNPSIRSVRVAVTVTR